MNDAQTWTLIGGFFSLMVATNALVVALVRSEITGLRNEVRSEIGGLRNEMVARFEAVHRDIQHLYEHVFPKEVE